MSMRIPVSGRDYQLRYAIHRLITLALDRDTIEDADTVRIEWPLRDRAGSAVDIDLLIEGSGKVLEIVECKEHVPVIPNPSLKQFLQLFTRMQDARNVTKSTRFRFVTNAYAVKTGASLGDRSTREAFFGSQRSLRASSAGVDMRRIEWEVAAGSKSALTALVLAQLLRAVDDPLDFYAGLYARLAAQMAARLHDGKLLDRLLPDLHLDLYSHQDHLDRTKIIEQGECIEIYELRQLFRSRRTPRVKAAAAARTVVEELTREEIFDEQGVTLADIFVDPPAMLTVPRTGHSALFEGSANALISKWLTDYETGAARREPLLVLGPFGCGKSSVLRSFAADCVRQGARTIPILVPLRDLLAAGGETPFREVLRTHVRGRYKFDLYGDEETAGVTYCLLCDGFDELNLYYSRHGATDWVDQCYRELASLPRTRRDLAVVISSRPILVMDITQPGASGEFSARVDILPFNEPELHEWCARYRQAARLSPQFSHAFLQERNLDGVARTPIVLYMIARVFREEPERLEKRRYSRADVYTMFLDWTVRKGGYELGTLKYRVPANYRHILQDIAWHLFQSSAGFLSERELITALRETFGDATPDHIEIDRNLLVAHMLQPVSGRTDRLVEFTHQSFREYLVAERVERVLEGALAGGGLAPELWTSLHGRPLNSAEVQFLFELLHRHDQTQLRELFTALRHALNVHAYWSFWTKPAWAALDPGDPRSVRKLQNTIETIAVRSAAQTALAFVIAIHIQHDLRDSKLVLPWQELRSFISFCDSLVRGERGLAGDARSLLMLHLRGLQLKDADLSGLSLKSADLSSSLLIAVDFARAALGDVFVHRAKWNACDLSQTHFFPFDSYEPLFDSCDFHDSVLNLSRMHDATFENCEFDRAHFANASTSGTTFRNCTWRNATVAARDEPHALRDCTFDRDAREFFDRPGVVLINPTIV